MIEIPLTQGQVTIIDDEDSHLADFKWHAKKDTCGFYAARAARDEDGKLRLVRLHREILNAPKGITVDHINHDTLDNRRANLRICTQAQNNRNRSRNKNSTSGFKGVSFKTSIRQWQALIRIDGTKKYLGYFTTPEEAARAYDAAARKLHGEFASLNFPDTAAA